MIKEWKPSIWPQVVTSSVSDGGDAQRKSFSERNRRLHSGETSPTQPQDPSPSSTSCWYTTPPTVQPSTNQLPAAGQPGPRHEGISHTNTSCRTTSGKLSILTSNSFDSKQQKHPEWNLTFCLLFVSTQDLILTLCFVLTVFVLQRLVHSSVLNLIICWYESARLPRTDRQSSFQQKQKWRFVLRGVSAVEEMLTGSVGGCTEPQKQKWHCSKRS